MKVVLQRVTHASVSIGGNIKGKIEKGLVVLVGIETSDTIEDINWLSKKISQLRIFGDETGRMNLSVKDVQGELLLISQFTLQASTKKGNRPSYTKAARPEIAIPLYEKFIQQLQLVVEKPIQTGTFGADMQVSLCNDGPVTIVIDSKNKA